MSHRLFSSLSLLLFLHGCTREAPREVDLGDAPEPPFATLEPSELTGTVLSADTLLGNPGVLAVLGSVLWVVDYSGDPWLHALDRWDGRLIGSFGGSGEGPGQFEWIENLGVGSDGTGVWAFDANAQRLTLLDTAGFSTGNSPIIRLAIPGRIHRGVTLASGRFFGLQLIPPDSANAVLVSPEGEATSSEKWPLLGADSITRYERILVSGAAHPATLCTDPNGQYIAVVYSAASQIDIFDGTGRWERRAEVPYPSQPNFGRGASGLIRADVLRNWYRSCAATTTRLYALVSGRLRAAFPVEEGAEARHVQVFDWAGKLQALLHLDRPVEAIAVDPTGEYLYATSTSAAAIYRFPLPAPPQ